MNTLNRPRRRWLRWTAWTTAIILVVGACLYAWHQSRIEKARTSYFALLDQARTAGEPATPSDIAAAYQVDDADNAVLPLRHAAGLVDDGLSEEEGHELIELPQIVPLSTRERELLGKGQKSVREMLVDLRDASRRKGAWWNLQFNPLMLGTNYSDLTAQRRLCTKISETALLATDRGDYAEAFDETALLFTPPRAMRHHPTLVAYLVGIGMQALALHRLEDVCARADIGGSSPNAIKTEAIRAVMQLLADEAGDQAAVRFAFVTEGVQGAQAIEQLVSGAVPEENGESWTAPFNRYLASPHLWVAATSTLNESAKAAKAAEATDWRSAYELVPKEVVGTGSALADKLVSLLTPSFSRGLNQHYTILATQRLARTALAMHLYRAEHGGQFPDSLQQLVPTYLPAIPDDPYIPGNAPVRYIRDAEGARLYSVGSNGVDDHGVDGFTMPGPRGNLKPPVMSPGDIIFRLTPEPRPVEKPSPATEPATEPGQETGQGLVAPK